MDALIIAAGFGSRLADISASKPLTPVCGVPLIEIGVRQAMLAGVTRVIVVTGHEADMLERFLADLSQRAGIEIVPVRLTDWSTPNGHSVIAGATRCDGDYLLMMADHMFEADILARLMAEGSADRGVTLAIDRRLDNPLVDPEDATWVRTDDAGRIQAIGKTITPYDAVDCGAFLCTPDLAAAIREAIAAGKSGSLSDGMQVLADRGRAFTMDIDDAWWLDVDDPRAHALAEEMAPWHLAPTFAAMAGQD
ncbi:NTP transferase domain-containing protein [Novosphingobium cyanobacteriorum]|uniref:NTP transferase domain-containing protein n=1 Tax=Novosphingobium cyanobacteriorum TaxID=3024215 RepID=A0ABT6CHK2_9SPHN|nr:NTP transferase domain-containing protein [Novosphingobium cyanobacteriorum]MDF8332978.1 NTP transferase domain-containing protein [Novosphingobium cyanobacteriorum]